MSRELLAEEIEQILNQSEVGRLGLCRDARPYVVPLCYYYNGKAIYFHGAPRGRKVDCIKDGGRACFLVDHFMEVQKSENPCKFNVAFKSVMVEGPVTLVEDEEEKVAALQGLAARYGGPEAASRLAAGDTRRTAVFKLLIEQKSGRANP
ncbi:MAG TPA: pyridoxamine 5'-phosphate oxidase family protein [Bacillota bacterium]|nr:pyridoxamine 5'-phosphate oxidase family protein [Bacillota bacterium]